MYGDKADDISAWTNRVFTDDVLNQYTPDSKLIYLEKDVVEANKLTSSAAELSPTAIPLMTMKTCAQTCRDMYMCNSVLSLKNMAYTFDRNDNEYRY